MLGPRRPVEKPFEGPENELHVDRLRTHPAAPHAARQGRHQADPHDQSDHCQGQQQGVGGEEREAQDRELAVRQVQQYRRLAVDLPVRQERENGDQHPGQSPPRPQVRSQGGPRVKPAARTVLHERREDAALGQRWTETHFDAPPGFAFDLAPVTSARVGHRSIGLPSGGRHWPLTGLPRSLAT